MVILPPQIRAAAGRKFVLLCAAGTQIRATVWILLEQSFQQKKRVLKYLKGFQSYGCLKYLLDFRHYMCSLRH